MITVETIQACDKEDLGSLEASLGPDDLRRLVDWLNEKDDNIRYKSFLLLQARSQKCADVYPYWETFAQKFSSSNSYQRSLGLMLIAENVKWDASGRFDGLVDAFLSFCDDEKPITVRQCVQSLCKIVPYHPASHGKIIEKLTSIDLMQRKETQRKILLVDILTVLSMINKEHRDERIDQYIHNALTGGILDEKTKKLVAGN